MSNDRARLLLHPVRMRVVIALSARDLTTRQIGTLLTDVPQASLYRAIAQLHEAELIEVAKEVRRGGAMERTYRMVPGGANVTSKTFTAGSEEEFLGTVQSFADVIVSTAARHLALANETWRDDRYALRHESLWITADEREQLAQDFAATYAKYHHRDQPPDAQLWALMIAAIPDHTVSGEDEEELEGDEPADSDDATD
ncbi:helix-turn-helix domain-containing protein [Demequina activiva]|uniref:Helix-turn-helix domain-containing protein n=1 Tax=Demequina activiva TaxID=1582364 RepID=A0A919Q2V8_9MICO|nr:helix-turn-helix domain-containing protein [Demequina activiva]GIG53298.1 hypothetical protein Dac01nite_00500 [Demequina activiva]